jgi:hypothetical protein
MWIISLMKILKKKKKEGDIVISGKAYYQIM